MSENTPFADKATELRQRKKLSILELADKVGTAKNNVYWAEGSAPGRSISAKTLRLIYRDLCKDESEWLELLFLWALDKDGNQSHVRANFSETIGIEPVLQSSAGNGRDLAENFIQLNHRQRRMIEKLIKILPANPSTEGVIAAILKPFK